MGGHLLRLAVSHSFEVRGHYDEKPPSFLAVTWMPYTFLNIMTTSFCIATHIRVYMRRCSHISSRELQTSCKCGVQFRILLCTHVYIQYIQTVYVQYVYSNIHIKRQCHPTPVSSKLIIRAGRLYIINVLSFILRVNLSSGSTPATKDTM